LQIVTRAFDRDLALFDASSTLTFFRQNFPREIGDNICRISTDNHQIAKKYFPWLYRAVSAHLGSTGELELWFFPNKSGPEVAVGTKILQCRRLKIFFISTKKSCIYQPGDLIILDGSDCIKLNYEDLSYGFLGLYKSAD
jgi:hypothetical protein